MIVAIGADHRGYHLKEILKAWLLEHDYTLDDKGAFALEKKDDYTTYAQPVAEAVNESQNHTEEVWGILICGGGVGMAVAANKFPGVRCGQGLTTEQVVAARNDDDINVLSLASDYLTEQQAKDMVHAFLTTPFSGEERHRRRLGKITQFEEQ